MVPAFAKSFEEYLEKYSSTNLSFLFVKRRQHCPVKYLERREEFSKGSSSCVLPRAKAASLFFPKKKTESLKSYLIFLKGLVVILW